MAERSRGTGEPEQWKICPGIHGAAEVRLQAAVLYAQVRAGEICRFGGAGTAGRSGQWRRPFPCLIGINGKQTV